MDQKGYEYLSRRKQNRRYWQNWTLKATVPFHFANKSQFDAPVVYMLEVAPSAALPPTFSGTGAFPSMTTGAHRSALMPSDGWPCAPTPQVP